MGEQAKHGTPAADAENIKVYLRLRPMNKLETSKRSKDCIELNDNPKLISVESPALGNFDFTFDQVFDEYTPQLEVYKESISSIPKQLLSGFNCAVMAYGQTGSGKTHTMLGEGMGVELNVRALGLEDEPGDAVDPRRNPEVTEGMIPRVIADIFGRIDDAPESVEYVIRCSFVEIYLERICDLLQPWREEVWIGTDENGEACIAGASEICCLDASDVYAMLARGHAYRTKANSDQNIDSSRSHVVFTLRLERKDSSTGQQSSSRLIMLDLAGSELVTEKTNKGKDKKSSEVEARMVNASLSSLTNVVRGTLSRQGNKKSSFNEAAFENPSKLAQLLKPCLGGAWYTTVICTASPSSYNINETVNTIRFGQQAREISNTPQQRIFLSPGASSERLAMLEQRQEDLVSLVKMLAHECKHVRGRTKGKDSGNVPLWEAIEKITSSTKPGDATKLSVSIGDEAAPENDRIKDLQKLVEEHRNARDKAESAFRDMGSEIASLRRQKESIANEKQRTSRELHETQEELNKLMQRTDELKNYLQTSQFREKEAVLFLRQFRTFYFRLLKSKAASGSGSTKDITADVSHRLPGVSDLKDLLDVDQLMLESGLIEESELGSDTGTANYTPSQEAFAKSANQAQKTQHQENQLIDEMREEDMKSQGEEYEEKTALGFGQLASYRQRLLQSPAGRLAIKKEQELEKELSEMGQKLIGLQNSLIAEKAMVEALSARQGAMGKMKAAQELHILKQELELKTNDLHAIVWKMNELHLANKTMETKVESREHHVNYLEEHLVDLQARNRSLVAERLEVERRLGEENTILQDQLSGMATQIWQLGDAEAMPLWRILVPYTGEQLDLSTIDEHPKRLSLGNLQDEDIKGLIRVAAKKK